MKTLTHEPVLATTSLFRVTLAITPDDLVQCQRLRYLVFNVELKEGLSTSERSGLDIDPFDAFCDHLMVHDLESGKLVGTYRLQSGETAHRNFGYYGSQLFDFSVFDGVRRQMLELGRACVHTDFRNIMVLHALWKGIDLYDKAGNLQSVISALELFIAERPGDRRQLSARVIAIATSSPSSAEPSAGLPAS